MKKHKWIICPYCEGEGSVENPAFERGFTSTEWGELDEDQQARYMAGDYDVPCKACQSLGRVQVINVASLPYVERRRLVLERREHRAQARAEAALLAEWAAERAAGC